MFGASAELTFTIRDADLEVRVGQGSRAYLEPELLIDHRRADNHDPL